MYKLYNVKRWGSLGIHFLLEEMGVPYTNIWMTPEQVKAPEFRTISPLGYIPALGLMDGRAVFESAAIVAFLVTAHPDKGMAPAVGTEDFGEFLSWLNFMSNNIYTAINMGDHGNFYADSPAEEARLKVRSTDKSNELWAILDERLRKSGPWLMGKTYSALDIYALMLTLWSRPSEKALLEKFPGVARLAAGVRKRQRLTAALTAHEAIEPHG
jgi:glutathione S-transferase